MTADWLIAVSVLNRALIHTIKTVLLSELTESQGGSLGSKMEGEEEAGEPAATCISVHSLAVAACGDMAEEKHRD